jgi:hypothetical protein
MPANRKPRSGFPHILKVGKSILRVSLTEALPAFHRVRIGMLFPKVSSSWNINALQG